VLLSSVLPTQESCLPILPPSFAAEGAKAPATPRLLAVPSRLSRRGCKSRGSGAGLGQVGREVSQQVRKVSKAKSEIR
jgi:hypothetical protein